ncbi:MAG: hypothetical protein Q7S40_20620 [Opitutaceae bacterium]|nr:hypothetical protein [Opitutaceae bacterium]
MNKDTLPPEPWSRRRFVTTVVHGAALASAGALTGRPALAATGNDFAYDVSRFSKTDPKLIAWEEVSRRTCPVREARRIAFGPGDVLHVAAGNEIVRLSPDGNTSRFELGAAVFCVAVAGDGTIHAGLRDHIQVLDARGNRRAAWEAQPKRSWFSGLAVGENDVFAADAGNRVVVRYDRSGKVLGRIGAKDAARNIPGLIVPSPYLDVDIHPDGLLRVTNPGRHRFEAYTFDGDFEAAWGTASAAITGFCGCCNPIALAVLPDGRIITGEKGLARAKVFRADGTFESVVAGPESFAAGTKPASEPGDGMRGGLDAAVDSRGRIHLLDRATAEIRILQPRARA